jgi:hypothetical protein
VVAWSGCRLYNGPDPLGPAGHWHYLPDYLVGSTNEKKVVSIIVGSSEGMKRKILNLLFAQALTLGLSLAIAVPALAAAAVIPASGGTAISADTTGGSYTSLGPIIITEGAKGDISKGTNVTLILHAPSGFQFNSGVTPSVSTTGGDIKSIRINSITQSQITVRMTTSNTGVIDTITIGSPTAIQVRPTAANPLASGQIYRPVTGGGTAIISGITSTSNINGSGGTNFGTLTEIAGATVPAGVDHLQIVTQPASTLSVDFSFNTASVVTAYDTGNNPVIGASIVADRDPATGTGTLRGTLDVTTNSSGQATFGNVAYDKLDGFKIRFTSNSKSVISNRVGPLSAGTATQVKVETAANGTGTVLASQSLSSGSSINAYGVTRDQFNNFAGNPANTVWSLNSKTGGVADSDLSAATGASVVMTGHQTGTGKIHADITGLTSVDSGTITVTALTPAPSPPPIFRGGGGGGSAPPPVIKSVTIVGFSTNSDLKVDVYGNVQSATQLKLGDGSATIDIPKSTKMVDINGKALVTITADKLDSTPQTPPPPKVFILGYKFGPDGAQFSPPLTLTLAYDPKRLPFGADENWIALSFWDGFTWTSVDSKVDINTHTLTAKINNFGEYALVVELSPATFNLSDLKIIEDKSSPSTPIIIQTAVTNVGGSAGKYMATLTLNTFEVNKKEVILQAGQTEKISFELKDLIPAKYTVDINKKSSQFTIETPPLAEMSPMAESSVTVLSLTSNTPIPTMAADTQPGLPETRTMNPLLWITLGLVAVSIGTGILALLRGRHSSRD